MNELKPCPFCGGEVSVIETIDRAREYLYYKDFWVECDICHIRTETYTDCTSRDEQGNFHYVDGKQKAIDVWNTRVEG